VRAYLERKNSHAHKLATARRLEEMPRRRKARADGRERRQGYQLEAYRDACRADEVGCIEDPKRYERRLSERVALHTFQKNFCFNILPLKVVNSEEEGSLSVSLP
jgi:hypothetical protein